MDPSVLRMQRQLQARMPTWNGKKITPLSIAAVERADIQTWANLKKDILSLPESVQTYVRELWVWVRDHKELRDPWMDDFYNTMK